MTSLSSLCTLWRNAGLEESTPHLVLLHKTLSCPSQWTRPIPLQLINQCVPTPSSGYVRIVVQWGQRPGELLCLRGRMGLLRCVLRVLGRLGRKALARGCGQWGFLRPARWHPGRWGRHSTSIGKWSRFAQHSESFFFSFRMAGYMLYLCHT